MVERLGVLYDASGLGMEEGLSDGLFFCGHKSLGNIGLSRGAIVHMDDTSGYPGRYWIRRQRTFPWQPFIITTKQSSAPAIPPRPAHTFAPHELPTDPGYYIESRMTSNPFSDHLLYLLISNT